MRNQHIVLGLALVLALAAPSFAQYGGPGGVQTFTVPTLTVGPGPLITSGTFTPSGDITVGTGAQLFIDDGTVTEPGLGFALEPTTGFFREAAGEINFTILGVEALEMRKTAALNQALFANALNPDNVSRLAEASGTASQNKFTVFGLGAGTGSGVQLDCVAAGCNAVFGSSAAYEGKVYITGGADARLFFETDLLGTNYTELVPETPSGAKTVTLPALTGTVLLGGATNTLGAVTTTINSGTQFNIHSDANITLDGDADNDGTGTVSILSSNDTQQVLLTNTAISLVSDAQVSAASNDLAGNINTFTAAAAIGSWEVTDGTDIARMQIDASGFLIDGDNDDDVDGVVTLQTANETTKVALSTTGVAITSAGNEQHIQSGFTSYRYQDTKTFVDETELDLVLLAFADEGHATGSFQYVATMANGTNVQAVSGLAMFACINQGDTEACTLTMQAAEAAAADAGTLACTPTINVDEANAVMFSVTCNQEADDAGGTFNWIIELMNGGVTATLQ